LRTGNANTGAELYAEQEQCAGTDSEFSDNGRHAGFFDSEDGYYFLEDYMVEFCDEIGSYNSLVLTPAMIIITSMSRRPILSSMWSLMKTLMVGPIL